MAPLPTASGFLDESGALVFVRRLRMSRAQAWAAVTDPARTARWIGPWSGDPASGTIQLTMTQEEGDPVSGVEVVTCEPPHLVVVKTGPGPEGWLLTVRVEGAEGDDGEHGDGGDGGDGGEATISLSQTVTDPEAASFIGPGWDFYLDRLVAAEEGRDPDALVFAPDYHPGLADYYRGLLSD